jgi:hypothetical protein
MDESGQSKQAQLEPAESKDAQTEDVNGSGHRLHESHSTGIPTTNPDFSVPILNPAFTQASPPPPQPPDARRDARIRDLEQRLEEATKRMERGAEALERARKTRR